MWILSELRYGAEGVQAGWQEDAMVAPDRQLPSVVAEAQGMRDVEVGLPDRSADRLGAQACRVREVASLRLAVLALLLRDLDLGREAVLDRPVGSATQGDQRPAAAHPSLELFESLAGKRRATIRGKDDHVIA